MTIKQLLFFTTSVVVASILVVGIFIFLNKNPTKKKTSSSAQKELITIAAFGDSLTAGYGVDLSESYPSILEMRLKEKGLSVNVLNMGVSGETTQGGKDRVSFILEQNPDIVLLGLGANDMLRSLPPAFVKGNLNAIIQELVAAKKKVVLLGMRSSVTNGAAYREEFDNIYKELAEQYDLTFVPFFLEGVALRPSLNINDGIHPNKAGYEKIVDENIMPILLPYLKKL